MDFNGLSLLSESEDESAEAPSPHAGRLPSSHAGTRAEVPSSHAGRPHPYAQGERTASPSIPQHAGNTSGQHADAPSHNLGCGWATDMRRALAGMLENVGRQLRPLLVDSACSGLSTEVYALQQLNIARVVHRYSVDPKPCAVAFTLAEKATQHHFQHMHDLLEERAECNVHRQKCATCIATEHADIFVVGFSCKPYSLMRQGRFDEESVQLHCDSALFTDVVKHLEMHAPHTFILENVLGWDMRISMRSTETWLERHTAIISALGLYEVIVIRVDISPWVEARRERLYMVGRRLASSHAAPVVLSRIHQVVLDILQHRQQSAPQKISDILFRPGHPLYLAKLCSQRFLEDMAVKEASALLSVGIRMFLGTSVVAFGMSGVAFGVAGVAFVGR
jgi:hypothetical protein